MKITRQQTDVGGTKRIIPNSSVWSRASEATALYKCIIINILWAYLLPTAAKRSSHINVTKIQYQKLILMNIIFF